MSLKPHMEYSGAIPEAGAHNAALMKGLTMRRWLMMGLRVGLLLCPLTVPAATGFIEDRGSLETFLVSPAIGDVFTLCWSTQFADVMRAPGIEILELTPLTIAIPAWSETGLTTYRLKGVSVSMPSVPPAFPYDFTVYMDNSSDLFGANPNCRQRVRLNAAGVGQAETVCTGGPGIPFGVTLNLTLTTCSNAIAVSRELVQQGVSVAGAAENNEYQ
jgi:hypothetical protein